jgi:hypothetical protein
LAIWKVAAALKTRYLDSIHGLQIADFSLALIAGQIQAIELPQ